jgi:hypothetical protein
MLYIHDLRALSDLPQLRRLVSCRLGSLWLTMSRYACQQLLGTECNGQQNDIPVQHFIHTLFVRLLVLPLVLSFCNEQEAEEHMCRIVTNLLMP